MLKSDKLMLKDRVLKTSSSISLLVPLAPLPNRWLDGCMEKVMATVKDQGFSVRRAAEEYAIPKSTVHDRVLFALNNHGCQSRLKPGDEKAAVSGASLESNPGGKIVHHTVCSMYN